MTVGLLLGGLLGGAVLLLGYAVLAPSPRLGVAVAQWRRGREDWGLAELHLRGTKRGWRERGADEVARWLINRGISLPRLRADFEITGRTLQSHLVRKLTYGVVGVIIPSAVAAILLAGGLISSVAVPACLGIALGAVMFWVPDLEVQREAAVRRHDLRRALACFLDLVAMSLAGGRGVPEALPSAARIGSGWAFSLLRDTLDHARYVGTSAWQALAELGERVDLPELQELGGALQLVADDGAKVRASLTARAATQRRRQLAEAEGEAAQADQSIEMAQVVLAIGFFLFLGFPAVVAVMGL